MGFGTAVSTVLRKYVVFSGRARRSEFWWFALFSVVVGIVAGVIDTALGSDVSSGTGVVGGIVTLALLLPSLSVQVRRLHDTGRSGWWVLLNLLPVIGWIVLLVFYVIDSDAGGNRFGPSPKEAAPASDART